jgi:CHAD domain-containing protein
MGGQATAGEMLAEIVGDLAAKIAAKTPAALADEPDAVHQLRTAVRRLRNVLAAFSQFVEPSAVGGLRAQLAEYGDRLGLARDLEVRAVWCAEVATEVGLADNLRERLVAPVLAEHAQAHAALVTWSGSAEAEALHAALCAWATSRALANGSARPAAVVAQEVLTAQVDRVLAHGTDYLTDEDAAHALRKACRRLRHTADAVTQPPAAVLGSDAAALGQLGTRVQSLLGDHRDALLLGDYVRRAVPEDPDERAPYAVVIEAAGRAADAAIAAVPEVLADLGTAGRAKVEGWTSGSAS